MTPAALRRALGGWSVIMGLTHALPVAFIALSAAGPSAARFSGGAMSRLYYAHFILLTAGGMAWLFARAARDRVFHGGPFVDFAIVLTGYIVATSVSGWLAGPFLILAGVRLLNGRPFLNPTHAAV